MVKTLTMKGDIEKCDCGGIFINPDRYIQFNDRTGVEEHEMPIIKCSNTNCSKFHIVTYKLEIRFEEV